MIGLGFGPMRLAIVGDPKAVGDLFAISASQQVAHWARLGREVETSDTISLREISAVLAGSRSYDHLSPTEQALVRADWSAHMVARREALNLAQSFESTGRTWVELDDQGEVVTRNELRRSTPAEEGQDPAPTLD